jgi:uncharacterized protein with GYD domain
MPFYMSRFSYTPETWARLAENPEDRRGPVAASAEAAGGKLVGLWYAFGEYDGYLLTEMPDDMSAASVMLGVAGSGALSKLETTVLMSVEDTLEALRRSRDVRYQAPGRG